MFFLENGLVKIPKSIIDEKRFKLSNSYFCCQCRRTAFVDDNCGDEVGLCKSCRIVGRIKRTPMPQLFISKR